MNVTAVPTTTNSTSCFIFLLPSIRLDSESPGFLVVVVVVEVEVVMVMVEVLGRGDLEPNNLLLPLPFVFIFRRCHKVKS